MVRIDAEGEHGAIAHQIGLCPDSWDDGLRDRRSHPVKLATGRGSFPGDAVAGWNKPRGREAWQGGDEMPPRFQHSASAGYAAPRIAKLSGWTPPGRGEEGRGGTEQDPLQNTAPAAAMDPLPWIWRKESSALATPEATVTLTASQTLAQRPWQAQEPGQKRARRSTSSADCTAKDKAPRTRGAPQRARLQTPCTGFRRACARARKLGRPASLQTVCPNFQKLQERGPAMRGPTPLPRCI